ncbi:TRAP transporter small permease [Paracoccus laeviglucosivorans]|uniref:TRAP transporter small permease protein n=1 Tax=Paracoccus laeviglucosivorans TaxID=1197861 RepID=A0A521FJW4_9RHOB|nr:TRAP transporter small permease [Paracoccus laeviglucosivorans]SMO96389.1 TRAP-type C4-dicarboxylate transport system, small permease component [Paracoccus laeviglucosivorans]
MAAFSKFYLALLRWIVIACMFGILFLIFASVVLRYAFNMGIYLSEGLSGLMYVWMTFVGALLVLYERGHIGVEMLVCRLPVPLRKLAFAVTHAVMLYVTWLLLTGSWQQMMINLHVFSPATRLPIGLMYAAGVFFAAASALFLIWQLIALVTGRLSDANLIVAAGEDEDEAARLMANGVSK